MHSSAVEKYAVRSLHALNPGKETPRICMEISIIGVDSILANPKIIIITSVVIIDRWQGSRRLIYRVRGSYK
jgi:hypothetical protein